MCADELSCIRAQALKICADELPSIAQGGKPCADELSSIAQTFKTCADELPSLYRSPHGLARVRSSLLFFQGKTCRCLDVKLNKPGLPYECECRLYSSPCRRNFNVGTCDSVVLLSTPKKVYLGILYQVPGSCYEDLWYIDSKTVLLLRI